MSPGVPKECPPIELQVCPPGRGQLLGFRFPEVPGVPAARDSQARQFRAAAVDGAGLREQMPQDEWQSGLSTLAGELDRADYHLSRFGSLVDALKARRSVAGGPVFGDPGPARALYCEAASYLSAVRTAVDLVVYVAARRSGASIGAAEKWKASEAISVLNGTPPEKYDTADITVLRTQAAWFETLNLYRNAMHHRGWHEQSFGYFARGDTAPEANNPVHNVMLVPDFESLKNRARPHMWTYRDRRWLDRLVEDISSGAEITFSNLRRAWKLPETPPGKLPLEKHPTVWLHVPLALPIEGQTPPALHVFLSKKAAKTFLEHHKKRGLELLECSFRALRRTTLQGNDIGHLFAYDANTLGSVAEVHLVEFKRGRIGILEKHRFVPSEKNGPVTGTLWLRLPTLDRDPLYILDYVG
jgi:hypothetical protein